MYLVNILKITIILNAQLSTTHIFRQIKMKLLFVMLIALFLTACAEFKPTDGMNKDQLNKMSMASGNGGLVMINQVNGYEIYQNAFIVDQKKLANQGNVFSKALVTSEKDVYFVFKGGNLVLSGVSGPEIDKFVKYGFASKSDLQFGDSIGATGFEVVELKKYGINNASDYQKLKAEFAKNQSLYGNDSSTKNVVKYLSDREAAKSQKIPLAQYIQNRQALEKKAKEQALAEQRRVEEEQAARRRNMKFNTLFVCDWTYEAKMSYSIAENLMGVYLNSGPDAFARVLTGASKSSGFYYCSAQFQPFTNTKILNTNGTLYRTQGSTEYYLVQSGTVVIGVIGR